MVSEVTLSKPSSLPSDGEDSTTEEKNYNSSDEDEENSCQQAIVLRNDDNNPELPTFGNVSVMNCNDIHFGNKTVYQGPVTIKQFLCNTDKLENGDLQTSNAIKNEVVINGVDTPKGYTNPAFIANPLDVQQKNVDEKVAAQIVAPKGFQRLKKYWRHNIIILVSILSLLLVSLTILMVILLLKHSTQLKDVTPSSIYKGDSDEQDKNIPIDAPLDPTVNLTLSGKLKMVTRLEWLAQPPVQPADNLTIPVPYVIIHHTATEQCHSQAQCVFQTRYIQTFHIESRNWWDIGYNFLIGGNGEVYEGRGWTSVGAHSKGYNARSIGIAFIGTFNKELPPERQIKAGKLLIEDGVKRGYLSNNYKVLAARQLQTTEDPGATFYENIKTWDHWAKSP